MNYLTSLTIEEMYLLTKLGVALTVFSISLLVLSVALLIAYATGYFCKEPEKRKASMFVIFPCALFILSLFGVSFSVMFPTEKDFETFCAAKLHNNR